MGRSRRSVLLGAVSLAVLGGATYLFLADQWAQLAIWLIVTSSVLIPAAYGVARVLEVELLPANPHVDFYASRGGAVGSIAAFLAATSFVIAAACALATGWGWNRIGDDHATLTWRLWEVPADDPYWLLVAAWSLFFIARGLRRLGRPSAYQLFLSYKSQDAGLARRVADQLIASGVRVWFAEYEVLLAGRERFEEAIATGIQRSAWGIALTNNRYVDSPYCRSELRQLLDARGPERVLEVAIPVEGRPHAEFPELAGSPRCAETGLGAIVSFIAAQTGWNLPLPDDENERRDGSHRVGGRCMGVGYSLEAAGWNVVAPGGDLWPDGTSSGPGLRRDLDGLAIHVNLFAGPESSPNARRQDRTADDREMYDELLDYLPTHLGRLDAWVRGVHLMFHSGLSQMAATYRHHGIWIRKHSIILPHPEGQGAGEFAFTFGFRGPFKEYCRHAHLMDALALSVSWGPGEAGV